MVGAGEVIVSLPSLRKEPMLYYVYLFLGRVGKLMKANILGSKKFLSFIENVVSTFVEDQQLYKSEICLETLAKILEPILCSGMVCLNIFEGSIMRYVCLVCLSICLNFCSFLIFKIFKLVKSFFVQNVKKQM
jgi:hypothetical protein